MKYFTKEIKTPLSYNVSLTAYLLDNYDFDKQRQRPAIILCPGGAYMMRSDREAEPIAIKMMSLGFQSFVLNYSVAPARFPTALVELASAVRYVRKNASEFNIDSNQICVGGMSAGGHLAASLGLFWNSNLLKEYNFISNEIKPNALLLGYSVLTSGKYTHKDSIANLLGTNSQDKNALSQVDLIKQVTSNTPPCFIWHTATDPVVSCQNSLLFAKALKENKVPFELHIFPRGGHGLSLANEESNYGKEDAIISEIQQWPNMFARWIKLLFD